MDGCLGFEPGVVWFAQREGLCDLRWVGGGRVGVGSGIASSHFSNHTLLIVPLPDLKLPVIILFLHSL